MRARVLSLIISMLPALPLSAADLPPLVSPVDGEAPRFSVVDSKIDETSKVAEITVQSATGIFRFEYHPPKQELKKVRLVVQKEKMCEGLTFWPRGAGAVQLREIEGCSVRKEGDNLVVELADLALKTMGPGGKVQFVNAYR